MSSFQAVQNTDEGIASILPLPHTSDLLSARPQGFPALLLPPRTTTPAPVHSLALLAARCPPSAFFGVRRGAWGLRNRSTVKAFCYTSRWTRGDGRNTHRAHGVTAFISLYPVNRINCAHLKSQKIPQGGFVCLSWQHRLICVDYRGHSNQQVLREGSL